MDRLSDGARGVRIAARGLVTGYGLGVLRERWGIKSRQLKCQNEGSSGAGAGKLAQRHPGAGGERWRRGSETRRPAPPSQALRDAGVLFSLG